MIAEHEAAFSVRWMCARLGVSSSGYYAWKVRPQSPRVLQEAQLRMQIRAFHTASRGTYGSPRIHRDLVEAGVKIGTGPRGAAHARRGSARASSSPV